MGYGIGLLALLTVIILAGSTIAGLILSAIAEWFIQKDIFF